MTFAVRPSDAAELRVALPILKGTIKNARRIMTALSLDVSTLERLDEAADAILAQLPEDRDIACALDDGFRTPCGIATALLRERLDKYLSDGDKLGGDVDSERLARVDRLRRSFSAQRDLLDEAEEVEAEVVDAAEVEVAVAQTTGVAGTA